MNETELKHIIALLLEDARQVYRLSPNSATLTRIQMAEKALKQDNGNGISKFSAASENEVIEIQQYQRQLRRLQPPNNSCKCKNNGSDGK